MTRRVLPSDPLSLLREGADLAPPQGAALRVAARLARGAAPGGIAGTGALAGASSGPRELAPAEAVGLKALAQRFARWSLLPLGAGVVLGAGGQAWLSSSALHPQPVLPAASARAAEPVAPAPVPEASDEPAPAVTVLRAPSAAPARSTLADERLLLDRARRQLASDEPAQALTLLEQHAQRFARGALTEEREAMWVNVLAMLGHKEQAKARGEAFQARFPNSLMGASVRAALQAADAAK